MKRADLDRFKTWFSAFCESFYTGSEEDDRNLRLKEEHTHRVCENMLLIAGGLCLDEERTRAAETAALFHDVGRFPQYAKYRTYRDSLSENHGLLGVKTLTDNGVLDGLDGPERDAILQAVKFHNAYTTVAVEDELAMLYLKMVRDADKLDIWRVFNEFYAARPEERPTAVGLGLPDTPEYSRELLDCILERRLARLTDLKTLNDFKLLKLTWVYDLNFRPSLRLLADRQYIERLFSTMPRTAELARAEELLNRRLREKTA